MAEMEQPHLNAPELMDTATTLVADDKGLLAMDESNPTCNKRLGCVPFALGSGGAAEGIRGRGLAQAEFDGQGGGW